MARDPVRLGQLPGGAELFKNSHLTIRADHSQRILVIVRSPLQFQRVEEIEAVTLALARVFPLERRASFSMLSDFREAPVRVHPALEPAFTRYREETQRGFTRSVIIVSTTVGRIRSDRLADSSARPLGIVGSVEEALEFLRGR